MILEFPQKRSQNQENLQNARYGDRFYLDSIHKSLHRICQPVFSFPFSKTSRSSKIFRGNLHQHTTLSKSAVGQPGSGIAFGPNCTSCLYFPILCPKIRRLRRTNARVISRLAKCRNLRLAFYTLSIMQAVLLPVRISASEIHLYARRHRKSTCFFL